MQVDEGHCYSKMYCQEALVLASPYLAEEKKYATNLLRYTSAKCFICIGCGKAQYMDLANDYGLFYVGIDPYLDRYFPYYKFPHIDLSSKLQLIKGRFENIKAVDLACESLYPRLWFFTFNVVSYIECLWRHIERMVNIYDIVVVSTWAKNINAKKIKSEYFNYLLKGTHIKSDRRILNKSNDHFHLPQSLPFKLESTITEDAYCKIYNFKLSSHFS